MLGNVIFEQHCLTGNMEIMGILLGKNLNVEEVSDGKEELQEGSKKIVFVGRSTALHVAAQMGHSKVRHMVHDYFNKFKLTCFNFPYYLLDEHNES